MAFSTTIKKKYWEMKLADEEKHGFFIEYKDTISFWTKRINTVLEHLEESPCPAVFLIGSHVERRVIVGIECSNRVDVPERYRGAVSTEWVYALTCQKGEEVE